MSEDQIEKTPKSQIEEKVKKFEKFENFPEDQIEKSPKAENMEKIGKFPEDQIEKFP